MPHDPVLHLLGLARKAGRLEVGEEPVGAACRARQARLVLLASDAAPNTCRRAAHFGEAGNVLFLTLPHTKSTLGLQLGRGACAMLAVTDFGLAAAVAEKLAQQQPEQYAAAAGLLRQKADRAQQRQKEKRQHEKNLREGKKHPWAPPPREAAAPPKPQPGGKGNPPASRGSSGRPAPAGTSGPRRGDSRPPAPGKRAPGGKKLTGTFRHKP